MRSLFYFHLKSGLIFLLATILAIGGVIYHFSEKVLISTVEQNLHAHSDFRKGRILAFIESEKRWTDSVSRNEDVVEHMEQLMQLYREHGVDSEAYQALRKELHKDLEMLVTADGGDEFFLFTPRGELAFTLHAVEEDVGADFSGEGMYGETILSEMVEQIMDVPVRTISNYGYLEILERPTVLVGAPIFTSSDSGEKRQLGIMVRPLDLEWLREMLSSYSGLGETGDVILAQKERSVADGVQVNFINILRSSAERTEQCAALQRANPQHFPMLKLASAAEGFDGSPSGSGWVMDPKCQQVYSVWSWIPELNWGMVVKQDRSEVLEPIDTLQQEILIAMIFSILLLIWLAQRQARSMAQPIEELTRAAQKDRVDEYPSGQVMEINQLAEAMCSLVDHLHRNEAELEEKVLDRTRALSSEKDFIEMILNSMQEGMVILDGEGCVVRVNQTMYQLLGRVYEFTLEEVFEPEDGDVRLGMVKGTILSLSGERIPVQVSQLNLDQQRQQESEHGARLMLFYDLRERVRMEEREQYLAFQSGVTEMSVTLLHNVGNAVTGINGHIVQLEERSRQLQKIEDSLQTLNRQSADGTMTLEKCVRGFDLTARLLDSQGLRQTTEELRNASDNITRIIRVHRSFDKRETLVTTFDLGMMIEDVMNLIREDYVAAKVGLEFSYGEKIYLTIQRNQMIQVLLNLLKNALVAVKQCQKSGFTGRVVVNVQSGEKEVTVSVDDNGIGIEPERQQEIFTPHSGTDANGSGYGLHSVANFINSVGGRVSVESAGHLQGARFTLRLPAG